MYLIEGEDWALLIDTGRGIGNLHQFVRTLTGKPLIVVNTHNHYDHTGGNGAFSEVYMLDAEMSTLQPEVNISSEQKKQLALARLNPNDKRPYTFSIDCLPDWSDAPVLPVCNGYIFELGNRPIEVIHTNGHTRGSICLLDRKARTLFTGDTANKGVLIGGIPGQYVSTHKESLENLLRRSNEFDLLFMGHEADLAGVNQIEEIISAEEDILNGTAEYRPCDIEWPSEFLYTKGEITVGFNHDGIYPSV